MIMEELKLLEGDEKAAAFKRSTWKNDEAVLGNAAVVEVKNEKNDDKRKNNTSGNVSYLPPKPP
eukprot:3082394-Prorocentrum_lima.AAC.1